MYISDLLVKLLSLNMHFSNIPFKHTLYSYPVIYKNGRITISTETKDRKTDF